MKKITLILTLVFFAQTTLADCAPSKDIKYLPDGTYDYTLGCHLEMGENIIKLKIAEQQIKELNEGINLKDLALDVADKRNDEWSKENVEMQKKLDMISKDESKNNWIYFGAGVAAALLAGAAFKYITK